MSTERPESPVSSNPPVTTKRRGVPPWVAGLLIVLAVAGGGFILWKFYQGLSAGKTFGTVAVDEKPSEVRRNDWTERARFRQDRMGVRTLEAPDYVRDRPANQGGGFEAKGSKSRLIANRPNNKWRFQAESLDPNFITADQRTLLSLRVRAANEDSVAKQLGVTNDQRKQLAALPRGIAYPIDPATTAQLEKLFEAWQAAPDAEKTAKAQPIIQIVKDLEAAQSAPTRKLIADRIEQIKSIVTADQLKLFQDMGRAGR